MKTIKIFEDFLNEGLKKTAEVSADVNAAGQEIYLVAIVEGEFNEESVEVPQEKTPQKTIAAIFKAAKQLGANQVLLKK